jgi:hypothetical protein
MFFQIIKIIRHTPNLQILKIDIQLFVKIYPDLIEQCRTFHYVSNTNKIKYLDFHADCTLEEIQLIGNLFPKLEYLKNGMKKKEINQIIRLLLSKIHHLFFLYFRNT